MPNRTETRKGEIKNEKRVNSASQISKAKLIALKLEAKDRAKKWVDNRVKEIESIKPEDRTRKEIKELRRIKVNA